MKHPDDNDTPRNPSRRWFLRTAGSAAAGVAAGTMMPMGAAKALEAFASTTGFTLDGMRFERALDALLEDMFLPSEQLANMRLFASPLPTAQDAYAFARNFGSPHLFEANMNNMLDFATDTARELDAAKALNPNGLTNFLTQIDRPAVYDQFHHILPDSSGKELVAQLRTTIAQDAHAFSEAQGSVSAQAHATYDQLRQQFAAFKTELCEGEADYARDVSDQSRYYGDMPSAKKAGGYPVPEQCKNRPEAYVGSHEQSGELRHYLGRVAPCGHNDITKG